MAPPKQYEYEYLRLKDAIVCIGQRVNFYGVVREYDQPKPTRGSDLLCTMTVEDMSYNSPGLRVLVFSSRFENIPKVKSLGDVIRFHRVDIEICNDAPKAVAKLKRGDSFVLFTGPCHYLVPISHMKEGSYFDLCCKILMVENQEPNRAIVLYVWDGTDARPQCIMPRQEADGRETRLATFDINPSHLASLSRKAVSSFPPLGTVLRVVHDIPVEDLPLQLPEPGIWVKFRNLTCRVQSGIYEVVFMRESKISLLPSDHELVKECDRSYLNRMSSEAGRLPQWSPKPPQSLTVTDYEHVCFSTLREVIGHSQVTYKFRCLVRVVALYPPNVEDFCSLQDSRVEKDKPHLDLTKVEDKDVKSTRAAEYVYRLRLTLEDPTASVHAFLCGEDAAKFFNGHPPAELRSHGATVGALKRKVDKLLGFEEQRSPEGSTSNVCYNPPWIKCCLKAYYVEKAEPWESRRLKIFGTTLPG